MKEAAADWYSLSESASDTDDRGEPSAANSNIDGRTRSPREDGADQDARLLLEGPSLHMSLAGEGQSPDRNVTPQDAMQSESGSAWERCADEAEHENFRIGKDVLEGGSVKGPAHRPGGIDQVSLRTASDSSATRRIGALPTVLPLWVSSRAPGLQRVRPRFQHVVPYVPRASALHPRAWCTLSLPLCHRPPPREGIISNRSWFSRPMASPLALRARGSEAPRCSRFDSDRL